MSGESCGLPIPSEIVVTGAGGLASRGQLNFVAVVLVASAANVAGSLAAYGIAAAWGEPVLLGPGKWVGIRRHHLEIADRWFQRWGMVAVFAGRLLPVIRTYISFPAGLARVPLGRFALLTFLGAVPWNLALAYIGYTLGRHYEQVARFIQAGGYLIAVAIAIVVVAWWIRGRRADSG
jgi:membrane protein DedA with SNARE-associated domain